MPKNIKTYRKISKFIETGKTKQAGVLIGGVVCAKVWTALRGGKEIARAKGWHGTAAGDAGMAIATGIDSAASRHGVDTENNFAARVTWPGDGLRTETPKNSQATGCRVFGVDVEVPEKLNPSHQSLAVS